MSFATLTQLLLSEPGRVSSTLTWSPFAGLPGEAVEPGDFGGLVEPGDFGGLVASVPSGLDGSVSCGD
ncbi:MAG: hypothetical protein ACR2HA_09820 [Nocardioides sp.]